MTEKELTVINQYGIHARAATCLINLCSVYEDEKITLILNDIEADAKSILELLMLEAVKDSVVTVRVEADSDQAEISILGEIEDLFQKGFYEHTN